MTINRASLPDPLDYYAEQGLMLVGNGEWRTTRCPFHGGSDSMRVNVKSGGWVCMACGEKGGDVLAFHMAHHGCEFVTAVRELGASFISGDAISERPSALPMYRAVQALSFESLLCAVAAGNLAKGVQLSDADRARLLLAAKRIAFIVQETQS